MTAELKTMRVKFFGSLREFGDKENAELVVPAARSVRELRESLTVHLREKYPDANGVDLLKDCAFADEKAVLNAESSLEGRPFIAVLPPVCGG